MKWVYPPQLSWSLNTISQRLNNRSKSSRKFHVSRQHSVYYMHMMVIRYPIFIFFKVFLFVSICIVIIKLFHKHRNLIYLNRNKWTKKNVQLFYGEQETLCLARSLSLPLSVSNLSAHSWNLVIYLGSQTCSLPLGLSAFSLNHSP